MSCLYVTEHGASVGIHQNRVEIRYQDGSLKSIPIEPLESIELFGRSQMTTQAIEKFLSRGIPVSFYAHGGEQQSAPSYLIFFRTPEKAHDPFTVIIPVFIIIPFQERTHLPFQRTARKERQVRPAILHNSRIHRTDR